MKGTIVFAGSLAQKPHQGGHTWVFLQYLLGFRQLGWDVLFLDRLDPNMSVDARGQPCQPERSINITYLRNVMASFGLSDCFAVSCDRGPFIGVPREQVLKRVATGATLINVMGFFNDREILAAARQRVFLDIDPGFGQMWQQLGLHDPFDGYDKHVTVGENIGRPDCDVPDCGIEWITTRQPVVLEHWRASARAAAGAFTSIGAWRGPYGPIEYNGNTYGLRAHEFRKFAALPLASAESFEVALDIHSAETNDLALLAKNRWHLADPRTVASDPLSYRAYIQRSKAEFMVAKNMYVRSNSGWFSDRSICYLAAGKPVLAQNTGLDALYPCGEGLLTFRTLEEAQSGVEEISHNYDKHARKARQIAEECFDARKVLPQLLAGLSLS